jgi:phosphate acetyltransferase
MARSIYVTGVGPADGRQIVELGMMELLARRADRVAAFRPLSRSCGDDTLDLLRERYRVAVPPAALRGLDYEAAAALQAELGRDELVRTVVDHFRELRGRCDAVLVLGTDFADTGIPDELDLNARLANEFGALVLPVVGAAGREADVAAADVSNAYRAYAGLGCELLAVIANRVPEAAVPRAAQLASEACGTPVYVLPEDPSLAAPSVAQIATAVGAEILLGDDAGLARAVHGYVFGGAMLPRFLDALRPGSLVVAPGDRADLLVGALAADAAGAPQIAGILLTLGERPDRRVMELAARLAPSTPVLLAQGLSFETATQLAPLEGRITTATPYRAESALGLFSRHVDSAELSRRIELERPARTTPMMFERALIDQAREPGRAHIVLPEGGEERILRAADILLRRDVCDLTLLGPPDLIARRAAGLGLDLEAAAEPNGPARLRIIDPAESPLREDFAGIYAKLRAHKGVTLDQARDQMADVNYFGTMLVHRGLADGMVSGAAHATAATLRPAFEIIKTTPGTCLVSSVFFICLADRVLVYGDCAVNPVPDADQLAEIAIQCAETAAAFGVEPRVAMLSYSTGASGHGTDVDKVRKATEIVRGTRPDLPVEGPIQYDAAVEPAVAAAKLPGSAVAGRATVLVFPDLNTGNNTYKAVQRSAGAVAVGPVLQGLRKPVNDLSRGALVPDIVTTVAITAIQAHRSRAADRP